jgi:hypothetical protein
MAPIGGVRAGYLSAGKDAIPDALVDDFEDDNLTPAASNWSWSFVENGSTVSSPTLAGSFSGEASDGLGIAGWVGERDSTAQISAVRTLIRVSNITEQAGQWAIGAITGSPTRGAWQFEQDQFSFISRVKTIHDGSGQINIVGGSTNIGSISANTNYKILWENIDYTNETYDLTITKVSDGSEVASVGAEPFNESTSDMDFFGWANGDGSGGTLATYADDIFVG